MKNKLPLVSILTPCFNGEIRSIKFFESILSQNYNKLELIFINDASTDRTEDLFFSYKNKLEKRGILTRYTCNKKNIGVSACINIGLKIISGEFLVYPDSDDFLSKNSIKEKLNFLIRNKDIAVVSSDAYLFNENNLKKPIGLLSSNYPRIKEENQFELLINEQSIFCAGCHMIRVSALKETIKDLKIFESRLGQNWQILLPIYFKHKHAFINKPLFNYIIYKNSISHKENLSFLEEFKMINDYEDILKNTLRKISMKDAEYQKYMKIVKNNFFKKRINLLKSLL